MEKEAVEISGRTYMLSPNAARVARNRLAESARRHERFFAGDRTVGRLANAGNALACWVPARDKAALRHDVRVNW